MDVVRHVVVNGVNGTGTDLGKENPDADPSNAPAPSPAIGVADEFRRRMRGALLKVPVQHAPSTPSSSDLGEEENVDSSNTQRLLR